MKNRFEYKFNNTTLNFFRMEIEKHKNQHESMIFEEYNGGYTYFNGSLKMDISEKAFRKVRSEAREYGVFVFIYDRYADTEC